jgi:hypothetical protein
VQATPAFFSTNLTRNSATPNAESGIYIPQSGDYEPFKIRGVEWEEKNIGQTSPYPCARNTITTTLKPNVPIYASCLQTFTITGLTGSKTPDNTLTITHITPNNVISTTGAWVQSSGSLTISLISNAPMDAGTRFIFSFNLTNGFSDHLSEVELVLASPGTYITNSQIMDNDPSVPAPSLDIYNPQAGDLNPMYIRNVTWEVKKIGQSSPYPCATNVITTTLRPSVPLYYSCLQSFSISGLTGADTQDNAALALTSQHVSVLQSTANWTKTSGRVVVKLTASDDNPMRGGQDYIFSVTLKNGISAQSHSVNIVVDKTIQSGTQLMESDGSLPGDAYNIFEPQAGDLKPLFIRTVEWRVKKTGQSTPCALSKSLALPLPVFYGNL